MDDDNTIYFKSLEEGELLEAKQGFQGTYLSLISPKIAPNGLGIFASTPVLSFDDSVDGLNESLEVEENFSNNMIASFGAIKNQFKSLKNKSTSTFAEVEASHIVVVKDLINLQEVMNSLRNLIGQPTITALKKTNIIYRIM